MGSQEDRVKYILDLNLSSCWDVVSRYQENQASEGEEILDVDIHGVIYQIQWASKKGVKL